MNAELAAELERTTYGQYKRWASQPIEGTPEISVVIPAYNEEVRILPTVGAIATHLSSIGKPWELIIADDGSTDNTVDLLQELELPNAHVLVTPQNGGKGKAVRRGVEAAKGKYILFADADQSTPIEQFSTLLNKVIDDHYDIAIGSRSASGARVAKKRFFRRFMSAGLKLLVKTGFRVGVEDTQCGFKLFTRESAKALFRSQRIDGFSFDLEVLYLARKFRYRVAEIPVHWVDAPFSKVDASKVAMRFLKDLLIIRWNDITGRYRRPF